MNERDTRAPLPEGRALSVVDPLARYIQEVQAYPLVSAEEEVELARRFHEQGDVAAAKKLVAAHLRLVVRIAMEYRNAFHNVLDLIQEGSVGLMQAVRNFDPEKGARLSTYASWWIRSYILKYILDNFRLIRLGTTKAQKKLFYNLMQEKDKIESMGYYATPVELSKRLHVPESQVIDMQRRLTTPEFALEAPVGKGEGSAILQDFLPVDEPAADDRLAAGETQDMLRKKFDEFSSALSERERKIFQERLLAELPLTLQQIADEYGITKERVRQIEARLIERLKEFFKDSGISIDALSL
ncbi:MAG: RNA polymerase factor sigma-32 [Proteobacteria bacterium]|nr:RNA polymerase factor sigma-32 [Pseudomonadota bacterium]